VCAPQRCSAANNAVQSRHAARRGVHLDELGDGADAAARELGEQNHALNVVILQQRHVRAHLRDALHLRRSRHSCLSGGHHAASRARRQPARPAARSNAGEASRAPDRPQLRAPPRARLDHDHVVHLRVARLVHAHILRHVGCQPPCGRPAGARGCRRRCRCASGAAGRLASVLCTRAARLGARTADALEISGVPSENFESPLPFAAYAQQSLRCGAVQRTRVGGLPRAWERQRRWRPARAAVVKGSLVPRCFGMPRAAGAPRAWEGGAAGGCCRAGRARAGRRALLRRAVAKLPVIGCWARAPPLREPGLRRRRRLATRAAGRACAGVRGAATGRAPAGCGLRASGEVFRSRRRVHVR
jgi:hypothetical protein